MSNQLALSSKLLAAVAVIFGPLTVLTGVFGMNVLLPVLPGGERAQFWWIIGGDGGHDRSAFTTSSAARAGCKLQPWAASRRLPDDLANQIAAGEVVERPASVVKELVENAIDAGRASHRITVEYGGKKLIRVEDDGVGMDPDDARLCLERHATSKIRRADDLGAISTLGFRGEALPSIASVSHFRLRTRLRGDAERHRDPRQRRRASSRSSRPAGRRARSIEVADLFYNLPARRKFLKSDAAESAQISRMVTQLALCYPEVGFTLDSAGRKALQCPPVARLQDRLYQIYGDRPDLIEVRREGGGIERPRVSSPRSPRPVRPAARRTCSSIAASSRTAPSRTRSSMPTASRRIASAARKFTCSSRCRRIAWTSTCTRPRPRSASASSRWSTKW